MTCWASRWAGGGRCWRSAVRAAGLQAVQPWRLTPPTRLSPAAATSGPAGCCDRHHSPAAACRRPQVSEPQALPAHGVTVAFVELHNTKLELLEPLGPASPIAKFLEKNGAGGMCAGARVGWGGWQSRRCAGTCWLAVVHAT